jgi:hypothetical protein
MAATPEGHFELPRLRAYVLRHFKTWWGHWEEGAIKYIVHRQLGDRLSAKVERNRGDAWRFIQQLDDPISWQA